MPLDADVQWCFDMILFSFWYQIAGSVQVLLWRVLRKSQEAVHLAMQKCGSLALLEVILGPTVLCHVSHACGERGPGGTDSCLHWCCHELQVKTSSKLAEPNAGI